MAIAKAWLVFALVAPGSTALVVAQARRDAADPARCGALVALHGRCCAEGQTVESNRCVGVPASCPPAMRDAGQGCAAEPRRVTIAGGTLHTGAGDWEASGRIEPHDAEIASFEVDDIEITESAYAACVEKAACIARPASGEPGRAMSGLSRDDARAYCAFREGRLPTDDEWTWMAGGSKPRRYPWGDTGAVCRRAAWGMAEGPCTRGASGPEIAGAHPDGDSPEGVHDLTGNVAEWVETGDSERGRIRGGSWQSELATDLRSWHAESADPAAHSAAIGARCVYDRK